jgi:protease I
MATVLIPLPSGDFDPTEAAVPWKILRARGHAVVFTTPDGRPGLADHRMLTGRGLGPFAPLLKADANGRQAYSEMERSPEFLHPVAYPQVHMAGCEGLLLPGGHAPGMRPYLESAHLQSLVAEAFARDKPVGAVCHGVLLAARARSTSGRSVLFGRKTTALTRQMELTAWALTCAWLGSYYRTYPQTVQQEVTEALAAAVDFRTGPPAARRDSPEHISRGFTVRDGNYLSARWPGDIHRFATEFVAMLEHSRTSPVGVVDPC